MTRDNAVKLERINSRLPGVIFGLSWDFSLHVDESQPSGSAISRAVRRLLSTLRRTPAMTENDFLVDTMKLTPEDQHAAKTLWAKREQLANLDAKALVIAGGTVIARLSPLSAEALDGALTNTGDDITGSGEGDDERISVNLNMLPERVDAVVLYVESAQKRALSRYLNPKFHVSYMRAEKNILDASLSDVEHSGYVVAILKKQDGEFSLVPVQTGYDAADPNALEALVMAQG